MAQSTSVTAAATAAPTPSAAVQSGIANAGRYGITSYVSVVDRATGKVVAESANANVQVASASIMKLFIATFYAVQAGGYQRMTPGTRNSLEYMIRYSDDGTASSLFRSDIIPNMAARYSLTNTGNAIPNAGHWGAARITAHDMSKFLYKVSKDGAVGPWLIPLMATAAATGSGADAGYNQDFGFNALTGTHGSKQGWSSDNWTSQPNVIHSVGYTSLWFGAVLQSSAGNYSVMPGTATFTARQIQAARVPAPAPPKPNPKYSKAVADHYVQYLVRVLLAREVGATSHSTKLQKGQVTLEQVAHTIVTSQEYRGRVVKRAFQTCLDRDPTSGERISWVARLDKGNVADLYGGACGSKEAQAKMAGSTWKVRAAKLHQRMTGLTASSAQTTELAALITGKGWSAAAAKVTSYPAWRQLSLDKLFLRMIKIKSNVHGRAIYLPQMHLRGEFRAAIYLATTKTFWNLSQK